MAVLGNDYSDDLMNYYYCTEVVDRNDLVAVVDNDVDFDGIHSDIDNLREYFLDKNMTRMNFDVDDDDDVVDGDFRNN
jgi:hypothetical protein